MPYKLIYITATMSRRHLLLYLAVLITLTAAAQQGLNIARFFTDDFISRPEVTGINISGQQLKTLGNGISLYRNVSVPTSSPDSDAMEQAVKRDGTSASSRTVSIENGHISFGLYALDPVDKKAPNRFIIFMRTPIDDGESHSNARTALFYIEGKADIYTIKAMLSSLKSKK